MAADGSEQADANLAKVDHVVVMMLENRSFDHLLGYLSLTGRRPDIDGLRPGFANEYLGRSYPVHHLDTTALEIDPDHSSDAIDRQVAGGSMGGFVASAAATLTGRGDRDGDPACVMGYYDGADVHAYHVPWRWYSFDPGTLRLADAHYLLGHHDRFGYFSKTGLPWRTVLDLTVNQKLSSFLDDAAVGTLPPVSWIDPAFTNFNPLGFPVNDDHPPADVKDGQDLVLAVYDALASSPQWETSRAPGTLPLNDLQESILAATRELHRRGHPPNTP